MKIQVIATFLLLLFSGLQSALAYSAIWNINGWDSARLKEAGITISTWKHDQIGEDPALNWLEITFDASKVGEDRNVIMTLQVMGDDYQTVSAHRVERRKGDGDKIKLLFAVSNANVRNSELRILAPELLAKGLERNFGDPGLGGYSLQLSRIIQLAAEESAKTPPAVNSKAEPAGTGQPAARPRSKSEGGDKPQPHAEGPSR